MIELNLTPDVSIIEAIRADARMNYPDGLSELIDNALDADAKRITVSLTRDEIRIIDDGMGCANLEPMLRLANHNPDGRRIGRYGVGFNKAAIWFGKSVQITTVHRQNRSRIMLNWDDLWPEWRVKMPDPEPAVGTPSGMDITIYNLPEKRKYSFDRVVTKLQRRYPFLLQHGRQLILNESPLAPLALPKLESRIHIESEWHDRTYRVVAGLTHEGIAPWEYGFTIMLRDRVMDSGKSHGCGEYGTNRFFGLVELLEGRELEDGSPSQTWTVDQTKTGLTDEIIDFLESLYPIVEPLLQKAETKSSSIVLRELEEELSGDWLNNAIAGKAKEKRPGEGGGRGTDTSGTDTGRKRTTATIIDDSDEGSIEIRKGIGRRVRVQFGDLEDGRIAQVDHNAKRTICILNQRHPFIEAHREHRKSDSLSLRMLVATVVYAYWLDDSDARPKMLGQLALPVIFDGQRYHELERAISNGLTYLSATNETPTKLEIASLAQPR